MKRLLILIVPVAIIAAAAVAIAAYSGGGSGNSAAPAPRATNAATVSAQEIGDKGSVLVDSGGRALYASNQEIAAGNKMLCTEGCEAFWMPLTVKGTPTGNSVPGELGAVQRPDGGRQVTLDGKLLYTFVEDKPGEVNGDGFEDAFGGQTFTWHVVHSDGTTGSSDGDSTNTGPYGY